MIRRKKKENNVVLKYFSENILFCEEANDALEKNIALLKELINAP